MSFNSEWDDHDDWRIAERAKDRSKVNPAKPSDRVLVFGTDGKARWEKVKLDYDDDENTWNINYKELQRLVGGYIESITSTMFNTELPYELSERGLLWRVYLNEEGRLNGMPTNKFGADHVGPAVLVVHCDCDGNDVGIDDDAAKLLPKKFLPQQ